MAGSVIVDEVTDIKELYERELTLIFKSSKSKKNCYAIAILAKLLDRVTNYLR